MMVTGTEIAAGWKVLGALSKAVEKWFAARARTKKEKADRDRAETLMAAINRAILSGKSSDDPSVAGLVKELKALIKGGANPAGREITETMIERSRLGLKTPAAKPIARKAAAPKAVATKPVAKPAKKVPAGIKKAAAAHKASPKKAGAAVGARKPVVKAKATKVVAGAKKTAR